MHRSLFLSVFLSGLAVVACSAEPEIDLEMAQRAEQQLQRLPVALDLIRAGDYGNAVEILTEVSVALPDSSHATTMAAFLHMRDASEYRRIHAGVHNNLGLALFRSRQFEAAASEYTNAAAADSDSSISFRNLAKVRVHQRRFEEAMAAIDEAERRGAGDAELLLDKATIARTLGDLTLAAPTFQHVIETTSPPRDFKSLNQLTHAHFQVGLLELEEGNYAQSIVAFEKALELNAGFVRARYYLARTLGLNGTMDASRLQAQRFESDSALVASIQGLLIAHPNRVDSLHYVASTYEAIGDYALADTHYRQLLAREPGNAEVRQALLHLQGRLELLQ